MAKTRHVSEPGNYTLGMVKRPQPEESFLDREADADLTMILDPDSDEGSKSDPKAEASTRERDSDPAASPEYALVVCKGQQKGRTWLLSPGVTRVGRHPYSDIALDHITVSRRHCRILLDATGLSIEDLGSTNGCYVNDHLVEKAGLEAGDRLMIGTFHLLVARRR